MWSIESLTSLAAKPIGRELEDAAKAFSRPSFLQVFKRAEAERDRLFSRFTDEPEHELRRADDKVDRASRLLRTALRKRLRAGELIATGIKVPASLLSPRQVIGPELWRVLEPDFDDSSARGAGLTVVDVLVCEPHELEAHVCRVASEDTGEAAASPVGICNSNYTTVRLSEGEFLLGPVQASVIRELHQASLTPDPWRTGRAVLDAAGSNSKGIRDVFQRHTDPSWRLLIEEKRARYRLRVSLKVLEAAEPN
ncbi:MAG TPA: hypothetical protein VGN97_10970 [Mesorhizobium sp.]|jgi:hypothetical protein|nr:hypothetical protein [Mesorhizobium sp.]